MGRSIKTKSSTQTNTQTNTKTCSAGPAPLDKDTVRLFLGSISVYVRSASIRHRKVCDKVLNEV